MRLFIVLLLCANALGMATAVSAAPAAYTPPPLGKIDLQYAGKPNYKAPVQVMNLDGFDTPSSAVALLKQHGVYPICYLNVGATENWRPDMKDFPQKIIGRDYEGWEGENWLDIRRIDLLGPIIEKRMDMCKAKGFLGIDPDNLDGFQTKTGFPLTKADQLRFLRWLADTAHSKGLAIGLKNVPELVPELHEHYDWALTESCFDQSWCREMLPFATAGKPVFMVEYTDNKTELASMCAHAKQLGFSAVLKHRELDSKFSRYCD